MFDPTLYRRQDVRAEFGYGEKDNVILFLGTPRPHKGIFQLADALEELNNPHLVLCIIGSIHDKRVSNRFSKYEKARIDFHEDQPWNRLPELISMADLVCIMQDPNSRISDYQIPAKITDAVAMGIPTITTNVPPLEDLILAGALIPSKYEVLGQVISNTLENQKPTDTQQRQSYFLTELSYAVNSQRIQSAFAFAKQNYRSWENLFSRVIDVVFKQANVALAPGFSKKNSEAGRSNALINSSRPTISRLTAPKREDPLNIIFFWKQNDSDIYGRRQDMITKYLANHPRVSKVIHFDAPISLKKLESQVQSGEKKKFHQGNLVYQNTLDRFLRRKDARNIIKRTFVYSSDDRSTETLAGVTLPSKEKYLDFIKEEIQAAGIEKSFVTWICPVCFELADILSDLDAGFIVADLIDDQRKWTIKPAYAAKLSENYRVVLENADVAITNCEPVRLAFKEFHSNISVIPNGSEVFSDTSRWAKPPEIKALKGPIIGYVGNLSDRIDIELLKFTANSEPEWNIVLIGSAHGSSDVFELSEFKNIHLLGVKEYEKATRYIHHFDVAIIPHINNELTKHMNPLKMYLYYALNVPIVSSPIANIDELSRHIQVASTNLEFVECIRDCLRNPDSYKYDEAVRQQLLQTMRWDNKVDKMMSLIRKKLPV